MSSLHVADLYFFHELSRTVGTTASKEWLGGILNKKSRRGREQTEQTDAHCKRKQPTTRTSFSLKSMVPNDISPMNPEVPASDSPCREAVHLPTSSLHASDMENIVVSTFHLEQIRSSPAMGNVSKKCEGVANTKIQSIGDVCNFGLLFTDAAHTVINDLG